MTESLLGGIGEGVFRRFRNQTRWPHSGQRSGLWRRSYPQLVQGKEISRVKCRNQNRSQLPLTILKMAASTTKTIANRPRQMSAKKANAEGEVSGPNRRSIHSPIVPV